MVAATERVPLPEPDDGTRFNFRFAMHAKLAKGGSMYVRRCDDFGIDLIDLRETAGEPFRRIFTADDIEGREFDTLRECVAALRAMREGEADADQA